MRVAILNYYSFVLVHCDLMNFSRDRTPYVIITPVFLLEALCGIIPVNALNCVYCVPNMRNNYAYLRKFLLQYVQGIPEITCMPQSFVAIFIFGTPSLSLVRSGSAIQTKMRYILIKQQIPKCMLSKFLAQASKVF